MLFLFFFHRFCSKIWKINVILQADTVESHEETAFYGILKLEQ
jgi:hypothetical protein